MVKQTDKPEMTLLDAMLIVDHFRHEAYKSPARVHVLSEAMKVISVAADTAMERQVGDLCTLCWGDGFHRPSLNVLRGPCEACLGSGRRTTPPTGAQK